MPDKEVHSFIGASSAARWIRCPGSVRLYKQLPERHETIYAATGTAAHEMCELCLLDPKKEPEHFFGKKIKTKEFEIEVTEQMVDAVRVYVDYVRGQHKKYGGTLKVEQPFDLSWLHPGMFGRNDACIIPDRALDTLHAFDYKNGRKLVAAQENPQLMYYSTGALGKDNLWLVERVESVIVQPNAIGKQAIDVWTTSTKDLYEWAYDVLRPAAIATEAPDAPCVISDECQWCEAQALCPAKREAALALLGPATPSSPASLPAVSSLTPEQIGKCSAFFTSDEFQAWVKALAAEEQAALARGEKIPGRKLVENVSLGNRKWSDESAVLDAFRDELGEDIYNSKLKSPAQLSALLVKNGASKAEAKQRVDALVTREETTTWKVVNEDDPRPAGNRNALFELF
jgi:hypothetical protein